MTFDPRTVTVGRQWGSASIPCSQWILLVRHDLRVTEEA
jgi:hypothetical protein